MTRAGSITRKPKSRSPKKESKVIHLLFYAPTLCPPLPQSCPSKQHEAEVAEVIAAVKAVQIIDREILARETLEPPIIQQDIISPLVMEPQATTKASEPLLDNLEH